MTSILIVYAHPKTDGHNPLVFSKLKKSLKNNNQDFKVIDLYKEKYDPVLHEDEHYTSGNKHVSKKNVVYQKMIKDASKIVFIFPVWWQSMPAIMKGFFDKVFIPGFAFRFKGMFPVGLLKGKKAAVIMTIGTEDLIYHILGKPADKLIKKQILRFCGFKTKIFHIGNAKKLNIEQKRKIDKKVKSCIKYLLR